MNLQLACSLPVNEEGIKYGMACGGSSHLLFVGQCSFSWFCLNFEEQQLLKHLVQDFI